MKKAREEKLANRKVRNVGRGVKNAREEKLASRKVRNVGRHGEEGSGRETS